VTGTIQAGSLQLGIADIERDRDILAKARTDAFAYMQKILPSA
jgi:RecG-like helicase